MGVPGANDLQSADRRIRQHDVVALRFEVFTKDGLNRGIVVGDRGRRDDRPADLA